MAFDEGLAHRVREEFADHDRVAEDMDRRDWVRMCSHFAESLPPK